MIFIRAAAIAVFLSPQSTFAAAELSPDIRVQLASRTATGNWIVRLQKTEPVTAKSQNALYWGNAQEGLTPLRIISTYEEARRGEMVHLAVTFAAGRGGNHEKGKFFYGYDALFGFHSNEVQCRAKMILLTRLKEDEIRALEGKIRLGIVKTHLFPEIYRRPRVFKNAQTDFYIYFDAPASNAETEAPTRVFIGSKGKMRPGQMTNYRVYWTGTYITINKTMLYFVPREGESSPSTLTRGGTKYDLTAVRDDDEIRSLRIEGVGIVADGLGEMLKTPCD